VSSVLPPRAQRAFPVRYAAFGDLDALPPLAPGPLYRYVIGLDAAPRPLEAPEVERDLRDPFATAVLRRGQRPRTAREMLAAVDALDGGPEALPVQRSYVVGDGSQIPWTPDTGALDRRLRFAIVRGAHEADASILVSTGTDLDSEDAFLQVLSWDPANAVYNFYHRRRPAWLWAGSSLHALDAPTRGRGPFDSHVNGGLVMKELKPPWIHWHSMRATVDAALGPGDALRAEPVFAGRSGAERFQIAVVEPGIRRWNRARLARSRAPDGRVTGLRQLARQVLETTTVNLISSEAESDLVEDGDALALPLTFFVGSDALIDRLGLEPEIARPSVPGAFYRASLARFGFALTDGAGFRRPGDTFFAFLVPEPAFEDVDVLSLLLEAEVLSRRLATCLLMVDFPNPIYSGRRARLLAHVPDETRAGAGGAALDAAVIGAVEAAAGADGSSTAPASPERELLALWGQSGAPGWEGAFARRIERYFAALAERLATEEGFLDVTRLAESRRRRFRRLPLAEFSLTVPVTSIDPDAPELEMGEDATVRRKQEDA